MHCRHKKTKPNTKRLPKIWLMTDLRLEPRLLDAVRRLPFGSGVIVRHYGLDLQGRYDLFASIRRICKRRGHMVFLAGSERLAIAWHADGFHGRTTSRRQSTRMMQSAPVHNVREIRQAKRASVDAMFLSPLFATQSHPGAYPLGRLAFNRLSRLAGKCAVIALGGMTRRKGATLDQNSAYGWAAIDAFNIQQKI
jgi:thiamine-phosphate pyrophosphorylase